LLALFAIFLTTPMVGYIFFQGNHGNIYDYYMSGYYFPIILLFAIGLGALWKTFLGKAVVVIFFVIFFNRNLPVVRNFLTATVETRPIGLEEQLQAVAWVFNDAEDRGRFNLDVYVPPVIPHSYDYLFLWQGTLRQDFDGELSRTAQGKLRCEGNLCGKVEEPVSLLYTLYEADPPHPERLDAWLDRQKVVGEIEEEEQFGMITVQRRKRF
jgi:hypothetical protein